MTSTLTDRRFGVAEGLAVKAPCRVATTANITLSGLQTIDGVSLAADDRVLVWNQTNGVENGIYVVSSGSWSRSLDFDGSRDAVSGTRVFVRSGTTYGSNDFQLTTTGSIVIETTSLTFAPVTFATGQPLDADLTAIAALTTTAFGRGFLELADAPAAKTKIALDSVTNDAQTKAAIVPNTVPTSGQLLVGNAGGTAYAPQSFTGDVTVTSAGVTAIGATKVTNSMMNSNNLANPSATIGLTAKNGSATTFMRSDAAPALDVSISPTWTGNHAFNGNVTIGDASGDTLTQNAGTWTLGSNYTQTRALGAAPAGTSLVRHETTTASGDSGGTTDIRGRHHTVTVTGTNNIAGIAASGDRVEVQTTAGTATQVNGNLGYVRLGLAGSITGGAINTIRWMWGHIANEGNSNISTAVVYFAGDTDLADGTGQIESNYGFSSGDVGHATRVTTEAAGFAANNITGGATRAAGFRSSVTPGTGKYGFVDIGGAGIGYGTGAGGAVTQATSKSTGVTLDKICGQVTMNGAALAAGAEVQFVLTNSAVAAGDILMVNHVSGGTLGSYVAWCAYTTAGSAAIRVKNTSAGSLSQAIVLGFSIIKAVAA